MVWLLLATFWTMQVAANLFFKYGSTAPSRWVVGFVLGNVVGASSIFFMMKLYARLDPNLAMALAGGGSFLLIQLALAFIFGPQPTATQWAGIALVGVGMVIASLGGRPAAKGLPQPGQEAPSACGIGGPRIAELRGQQALLEPGAADQRRGE